MKNELLNEIQEVEKRYLPIKAIIENSSAYKELYKGIISIQSPIISNPDILFIGINPGEGAFLEKKHKQSDKVKYPSRLTRDYKSADKIPFDWLKEGNARGEFKDSSWVPYKWWNRQKPVNNEFPKGMIDMLYAIGAEQFDIQQSETPTLFIEKLKEELIPKVMYTNVNPIASKTTKELDEIIGELVEEPSLKNHWSHKPVDKVTSKVVKNFFRQRTFDVINVLKPKVVVCLGNTVYKELCYQSSSAAVHSNTYEVRGEQYPFVTFSRQGNWSSRITKVAKEVSVALNEVVQQSTEGLIEA